MVHAGKQPLDERRRKLWPRRAAREQDRLRRNNPVVGRSLNPVRTAPVARSPCTASVFREYPRFLPDDGTHRFLHDRARVSSRSA